MNDTEVPCGKCGEYFDPYDADDWCEGAYDYPCPSCGAVNIIECQAVEYEYRSIGTTKGNE